MAPEAYLQGNYTEKSDIYSLGRTLEYLYRGRHWEMLDMMEEDRLIKVLQKAGAEEPSNRYEHAGQLKEALAELQGIGRGDTKDRSLL